MDLKPDPVKILDIAEIVRSPTEKDLGPWFYVDARQTPIFIEVSYIQYKPVVKQYLNKRYGTVLIRLLKLTKLTK